MLSYFVLYSLGKWIVYFVFLLLVWNVCELIFNYFCKKKKKDIVVLKLKVLNNFLNEKKKWENKFYWNWIWLLCLKLG